MSVRLMGEVWSLDLGHAEQLVLLAMADHADDHGGQCYPSLAYLAWKTGYSKRQIQNIVKWLKSQNIVRVVQPGRWHFSQRYQLNLKSAPRKPDFRDENFSTLQKPGAKTFPPSPSSEVKNTTVRVEKSDTQGGNGFPPNHTEPSIKQKRPAPPGESIKKETVRTASARKLAAPNRRLSRAEMAQGISLVLESLNSPGGDDARI